MRTIYKKNNEMRQHSVGSAASAILDNSLRSESLRRKADMVGSAAQHAPRPNLTGLPDDLKSGIENLSGFSMDDVRVHYNSSKPATVQALAYTQGTDIHVAPGQEKHLPHEAWHVVQQKAGRVSPTTNINGMPVNDNAALEHEADMMGEKAIQSVSNKTNIRTNNAKAHKKTSNETSNFNHQIPNKTLQKTINFTNTNIQRMVSFPGNWSQVQGGVPTPQGFSSSPSPNITFDRTTNYTPPAYIPEMEKYRNIIIDPSTKNGNMLTRMHMINGRFGGPGDIDNLRYGTHRSNGEHRTQVEAPIENFLHYGIGQNRRISYTVSVGNPSVPSYILGQLNAANMQPDFFIQKICPSSFVCSAIFYTKDATNQWWWSQQIENIPLNSY